MHIELVTEGGFAAIPGLNRPQVLDGAAAVPAVRDEVGALVQAALAEQRHSIARAPSNYPDARRYQITVEQDGKREVLVACDAALPPAFDKLLQYLRQHGQR